ncbi:enterochelin esterase-like enzyme [Paenibacillus sp. JGP012]|uniref:alpha/beta hydrolase n=1 Tax=Paenibacillus sp. JGP012 TaxID=2735914 RepID=UPI0016229BEA|nr:alpha/beta hydrolase-fold protein [Paenibacillus sp. JGP012]MBB6022967.1 enterochelin esterase-like enzyme [Paenibacillus sp. JGP012]
MKTQSVVECLESIQASQLGNRRNIYVYLPPGYEEQTERHYPVLYAHAGQRVFGPSTPGNETWQLDRVADELISSGRMEPIIIVAIAHVRPVTRNEFYHYVDGEQEFPGLGGSGREYEHFIIQELKPMIDRRYRTKRDRDNTGLLGSSAAALCNLHIGMHHPDVFGKLIMMSPYFVDAQLDEQAENGLREKNMYRLPDTIPDVKMWVDIGDTEGLFLPEQVRRVVQEMLERGAVETKLAYFEQPDACHQEADWGARVHVPLIYMFGQEGQPISLELYGRTVIGLKGGMQVRVQARLQYDNGLSQTLLTGKYVSSHPEVLQVLADGTLIPHATGSATITLQVGELAAARDYSVIPELTPVVQVCMQAELASGFTASEQQEKFIYGGMGMKLMHVGDDHYEGCYCIPRDSGFSFRFTRGFRQFETDLDGHPIANRVFRATENRSLHYHIQAWGSTSAKAETGGSPK